MPRLSTDMVVLLADDSRLSDTNIPLSADNCFQHLADRSQMITRSSLGPFEEFSSEKGSNLTDLPKWYRVVTDLPASSVDKIVNVPF